jgi:hypothetical protein
MPGSGGGIDRLMEPSDRTKPGAFDGAGGVVEGLGLTGAIPSAWLLNASSNASGSTRLARSDGGALGRWR